MRNLKKFLALVMAMVMAFSLMVTVNAAHIGTQYTDEDDVTPAFEEAMEVLTGMGVYQGDPGATFRPASTITRAETAALIYRLATGDTTDARKDLYKDYGNFADVTSTDWFAGYVGYCANAGYIKGHGGYFNPYGQVTGYEVLAMVLRAVGYDKNHEFEGATWQTNVSALSTQLGVLKQVKSTHYGDRLYEPSRRDVVASLLFETAVNVNMVNYSAMAGYNKYTNLVNTELNPTLGYKNFGLTNTTRIVLGNQATGETGTVLGAEKNGTVDYHDTTDKKAPYSMYSYPGTKLATSDDNNDPCVPAGVRLDWKSDLTLFGHKVNVWYNATDGKTNHQTYALWDKATLATVVYANSADIDDTTTTTALGKAAKDAGFDMTKTDGYHYSQSFGRFSKFNGGAWGDGRRNAMTDDPTRGTKPTSIWTMVSNSEDKTLDVLVPTEVSVAKVARINNIQTPKTVTFGAYDGGTFEPSQLSGLTAGLANQSRVMNPEAIVLNDKVIITEVFNTTKAATPAAADRVYWLDTVTKTVTGTVVAWDNANHVVTLSDGTTLKQSILWDADVVTADTVVDGTYTWPDNSNTKPTAGQPYYNYGEYTFTVDMQGRVLAARQGHDVTFVYGTYADYSTALGTSTINYQLIGVDEDGKQTITDFNKFVKADRTVVEAPVIDVDDMGVHTRQSTTGGDTGVKKVAYVGFAVNGSTVDASLAGTGFGNLTMNSDMTINGTDVTVSVKQVPVAGANGTVADPYLYFTSETVFHVVDGYGTDSQKVQTFTGIDGLRDGHDSVKIDAAKAAAQIYYSSDDYKYADVGVIANQAKVVFLPKEAVTWSQNSDLYFIGTDDKVSPALEPGGGATPARLYTMYRNGDKVSVWLRNADTPAANTFYRLEATGDKTTTGEIEYKLVALAAGENDSLTTIATGGRPLVDTNGGVGQYWLSDTTNGNTTLVTVGAGTGTIVNVGSAKIVNLIPKATAGSPFTIESLADLNALGSQLAGTDNHVRVCYQMKAPGSLEAAVIYVVSAAKI